MLCIVGLLLTTLFLVFYCLKILCQIAFSSIANYFRSYIKKQFGIKSIGISTVDVYNKVVSYRISSRIIKQCTFIIFCLNYCQTSPNKNKSSKLWHVTSILVCCIFVPTSYIICFRQNRKASLFLIKGSCSPNEMRTAIHKLLKFIKLPPNTFKHVWAGI